MIVYRLTKSTFKDEISGVGAELYSGRWNSKGTRIIYTGESRALCTAEIAVHTPLGIVPTNYYLQTIELPGEKIVKVSIDQLSKNWRDFPHRQSTRTIVDRFIRKNANLILQVPSAVIQDEYNYLINPFHPAYQKIKLLKIEEFKFDKRLFGE